MKLEENRNGGELMYTIKSAKEKYLVFKNEKKIAEFLTRKEAESYVDTLTAYSEKISFESKGNIIHD